MPTTVNTKTKSAPSRVDYGKISSEHLHNPPFRRKVKYRGKVWSLGDLAASFGLRGETVNKRLRLGWTLDRALTQPLRKTPRNTVVTSRRKLRIYNIYKGMIQRCYTVTHPKYRRYGGRGIRVCKRWRGPKGFDRFLADVGHPPTGCTLDRENNDGNYTPRNCRWADRKTQARNCHSNRKVEWQGQVWLLIELVESLHLRYHMVYLRLYRYGWTLARALTQPAQSRKGKHAPTK